MFCSCFVVFSVKSLIIERQSGPGEILRCDCGQLAPKSLGTAALITFVLFQQTLVLRVGSDRRVGRVVIL